MDGNLDFDIINCAKEDVQSHSTMQSHSTKNVLLIIIRTNIMSEDVQPCSLRLFYEGLKHCMDTCARFISENSTGKVEECKYCIEFTAPVYCKLIIISDGIVCVNYAKFRRILKEHLDSAVDAVGLSRKKPKIKFSYF